MSVVKTFGTPKCKLCAKERLSILSLTRKTPHLAINKCNEVYGACRHNPNFHRFNQLPKSDAKTSTDEPTKGERVEPPEPTPDISDDTSCDHYKATDPTDENENVYIDTTNLLTSPNGDVDLLRGTIYSSHI